MDSQATADRKYPANTRIANSGLPSVPGDGASYYYCTHGKNWRTKDDVDSRDSRLTGFTVQLRLLYPRKTLPLKDRPAEPLQTLLSTGLILNNLSSTIISPDRRTPKYLNLMSSLRSPCSALGQRATLERSDRLGDKIISNYLFTTANA